MPKPTAVQLARTIPSDLSSALPGLVDNGSLPVPLFEDVHEENEPLASMANLKSLSAVKCPLSSARPCGIPGKQLVQGNVDILQKGFQTPGPLPNLLKELALPMEATCTGGISKPTRTKANLKGLIEDHSASHSDSDSGIISQRSPLVPPSIAVDTTHTTPPSLARELLCLGHSSDWISLPFPLFEDVLEVSAVKPSFSSVKFLEKHIGQGNVPQERSESPEDEPEPAPQCETSGSGDDLSGLHSTVFFNRDIENEELHNKHDESCAANQEDGMASRQIGFGLIARLDILKAQELAQGGGGLSGYTTIMMRHIPCRYSQGKLAREVNYYGFKGQYDYFYLPMDRRSQSNRGFAFINFLSAEIAEAFYQTFHGKRLQHFNSDKVLMIVPADHQGFEENAAHYLDTLSHKSASQYKPLFFRSMPEDLLVQSLQKTMADTSNQGSKLGLQMGTANTLFGFDVQDASLIMQNNDRQDPNPSLLPSTCPSCGVSIKLIFQFCPYCGGSLS